MKNEEIIVLLTALTLAELTVIALLGYHYYSTKVAPIVSSASTEFDKLNSILQGHF